MNKKLDNAWRIGLGLMVAATMAGCRPEGAKAEPEQNGPQRLFIVVGENNCFIGNVLSGTEEGVRSIAKSEAGSPVWEAGTWGRTHIESTDSRGITSEVEAWYGPCTLQAWETIVERHFNTGQERK